MFSSPAEAAPPAGVGGRSHWNPLDWEAADRCLLVAALVLTLLVWFVAVLIYALAHPEQASYLDFRFLADLLLPSIERLVLPAWVAIAVWAALARRRKGPHRALVEVVVGGYVLTTYPVSVSFGLLSNAFASYVVLGGVVVTLALFGERPAVRWFGLFIVGLVAWVAASQLGRVPYAPALRGSPFVDGRLASSWLVGVGGGLAAMLVAAIGVISLLLWRWREQDQRLAEGAEQLTRANETISRYVASQIAERILAGETDFVERHERRRLTLFFSGLREFASLADRMEPEDLSELLNEYLSEMAAVADEHGGTIDKFVSDQMMVFFGAPDDTDDREGARRAVRMALAMQARMAELREKWEPLGFEASLELCVGINSGRASIGNFGAPGRLAYTAIGRQVNLAARLQTSCPPGRIRLSHATWLLVRDDFQSLACGEIDVKGFDRPVRVYEVAPP